MTTEEWDGEYQITQPMVCVACGRASQSWRGWRVCRLDQSNRDLQALGLYCADCADRERRTGDA
jgi:hypothetical protein